MTYRRVVPRDLFNEASLLKCLGQLYLRTEQFPYHVRLLHTGHEFHVMQDQNDGSIHSGSITLLIGGKAYDHSRPLNSREPWPLWLVERNDPDAEPFEAFDAEGGLSPELDRLIRDAMVSPDLCAHGLPLRVRCDDCAHEHSEATA